MTNQPEQASSVPSQGGRVTLVGGGPGQWDLLTIRGLKALEAADVILTDHLGPTEFLPDFLDLTGKEIIDVAKLPYVRQVAQERTNELLVEHARTGKAVVRLKGGDPFVFGRGFEEMQACAAAGIPCEVVPGVTSAVAVPAGVGVPITQRGLVHSFVVVSGHLPPGHPKSLVDWDALARLASAGATISVIMGVKNVGPIATALVAGGLPGDTPTVIIQDGETPRERSFRAPLDQLAQVCADNGVRSPAVYVIGSVAGLELSEV